jgi:hypothetical protein
VTRDLHKRLRLLEEASGGDDRPIISPLPMPLEGEPETAREEVEAALREPPLTEEEWAAEVGALVRQAE